MNQNSSLEELLEKYYDARKQREEIELSNACQQAMLDELASLDYIKLVTILTSDVSFSLENLNKEDNEFYRRTYLRNIFAFIEGVIYTLKQEILSKERHSQVVMLRPEEILAIKEKAPQVKENGEVKEVTKYTELISNVRLTFKYYAKVFNVSYNLDVSGELWGYFRDSLNVRHRITHPKQDSDMSITDEELVKSYLSYKWFKHCVLKISHERIQVLKNQKAGQ